MIPNPEESQVEALRQEIGRLQEQFDKLQKERDKDRQLVEILQEERSQFLRYLCAQARQKYTKEQIEQWANEEPEDGVPLSDFIHELEQLADEHAQRS